MKKLFGLWVCFLAAGGAWGQESSPAAPVSSSLRVSSGGGEVSSSIDLLKQSFQASSQTITGVASSVSARPAAPQTQPAQTAPAAAPAGPSTLELPLELGGTVESVQTEVAPVKQTAKPLSPAVARRVQQAKEARSQNKAAKPTTTERQIEKNNSLLPGAAPDVENEEDEIPSPEEAAAEAELEYAVKMLEESKEKAASSGRMILPAASKNRPSKVPAPNKAFNPNAYRPGVTWLASKSTHFDIYTQKRSSGISSANMAMTFESAYQTLRRFIPWMMSGRVRVFVYQDRASYLRHEPNAIAWSRAVAYPTRGEIVVYDEPNKAQELKESFTHELTHIFTQQFFDSHKTGRMMTPLWLDEGLAVFMEDQAYNATTGGPWANDFKTLNFQRSPEEKPAFGSPSRFGSSAGNRLGRPRRGKPVFFVPFDKFMQEDSLQTAEARGGAQNWYFQAYAMVRFLLNPAGSSTPSNRMQFEQFTRLLAQGEPKRDPDTGFLVKDAKCKTVYEPYSAEKALAKAYRYNNITSFEDNFWRWAGR